ncbi:MAG: murein biosynthesis integral membrane protein MurJ [Oscillospiraceae bacterium]|nr:murein biosynthesis integral membrane protein MurJ [Oscillospiraceae bacterium]
MPIEKNTLLKSVIILSTGTMLSRLTGFVREMVLAANYGADIVSDAFILAFTIPDSLLVFISGAVAASFIPMYHRVEDTAKFTRNIMTCLLFISLAFSVVFTIFPGALVRLFAFQLDPETFEIAVFFVRYMVWSAVFILLMDVYNAHLEIKGAFFVSGIRPVWRNITVILGLILGSIYDRNLIIALAPVAGSALSMLVLSIANRKHQYTYRPYLDLQSPDLRQVFILTAPIFLATASGQINMIISRNFAATLPVGTISYLNYSNRVAALFVALFGHALFTVLYPHMSKLAASDDIAKLKGILTRSIIYITAIMLPLCIGLIVLAEPGVRIMFERGHFTAEDTARTAAILRMHAMLLLSGGINPLIVRGFFAVQSTKAPAYISIAAVLASIALHFWLIGPLGAEGLALAASLSAFLATLLLIVFLRKKLGSLGLRKDLPELAKISLASLAMGVCVWLLSHTLPLLSVPTLQSTVLCIAVVAAGALVYGALLLLMKSRVGFDAAAAALKLLRRSKTT